MDDDVERTTEPVTQMGSSIHSSIHVYSQKEDAKCKQNHDDMQDRKVVQDSYALKT